MAIDDVAVVGGPFDVVEREMARYRLPAGLAPVLLATAAVGFFGYELDRHLENVRVRHPK